MSDDQVAVKITADASKVKPGVDAAKGEIAGLAPMLAQLNSTMTAMAATMKTGFDQMAAGAAKTAAELKVLEGETEREALSLKSLAMSAHEGVEGIESLKSAAMGIAEVWMAAFAVERIAEWGKEFAEQAEKVAHLSQTFGMTTNQVQQLGAIATATGIPLETITRGMAILDKNAVNASGSSSAVGNALKQIGISANDGMTQMERMSLVADKFANMADGPNKTALAMELFGRSGAALIPVLNLGAEGMAEITKKATEYNDANSALSASAQESGHALAESINEGALAWGGITNMLGDAFAPVLKEIVDSFSSVAKACVDSYTSGGIVAQVFMGVKTVIEEVGAVVNFLAGVFAALWNAVVEIVRDIASAIADVFGVSVPNNLKVASVGLNVFKDAFVVAKDVIIIAIELIKGAIIEIIDWLAILAVQAKDALTLNWDKMGADWSIGLGKLKKHVADTATEIKAAMKEAGDAIAAGMKGEALPDAKKGLETGKGGGDSFDPTLGKTAKAKDDLVQHLDEQLKAKQVAWALEQDAQGTAQEYSLQSIADYWKNALQRADLSEKDRLAIEEKYLAASKQLTADKIGQELEGYKIRLDAAKGNSAERLAIATEEAARIGHLYGTDSKQYKQAQDQIVQIKREAAEQVKRIAQDMAATVERLQLGEANAAQQAAQFQVEMGVKTKAQLLDQEQQFEARRHAIQIAGVQAQIDAERAGPNNPVALAKLYNQLLVLDQQYQTKKTALLQQAELQRTAIERRSIDSVASSWGSAIGKMVTLQQSFASTIKQMWQGLQQAIGNAIGQIITQWLTQQLSALLLGGAASKASAAGQIANQAAVAGAGGVASMAAAPWPLDMTAPAFGTAMAAAAGSFAGLLTVPGFDTGAWDLSKDQLAMVHSGEMIIPANIATPMRAGLQAAANGNAPAAANDRSGDTHNHYTIYAMDGQDVERVLMKHSTKVAKAADHGLRSGYQPKR